MITFFATIVVLGMLIFFHELGHFTVAKLVGIKVYEFSLGFGPRILGFDKGDTQYNLRIFPLGGFVKMAGMDDNEDREAARHYAQKQLGRKVTDEDNELIDDFMESDRGFNSKSVLQRIAVIFAGPFMNFVLAAVLLAIMFSLAGDPDQTAIVGKVYPGWPAAQAGIKAGDRVLEVNHQSVKLWRDLRDIIAKSQGKDLILKIQRNNQIKDYTIHPKLEEKQAPMIGIEAARPTVTRAMTLGVEQTGKGIVVITKFLGQLFTNKQALEGVGGPVRIVSIIGSEAHKGLVHLVSIAAILSINLGLFNLLPIPALDGSRILFLGWEAIRGKPVDPHKENFIHLVGFGLLLLLMVVITYNDITQIFIKGD